MDLVHPQLSKLLKSIKYGCRHNPPNEREKTQNMAARQTDKHSHVPVADFLLLFHTACLKSRTETFCRLSGTFSEKPRRGADKIFRRAFQSGVGVDKTLDGSLQPYPCLQSVNVCPRKNLKHRVSALTR